MRKTSFYVAGAMVACICVGLLSPDVGQPADQAHAAGTAEAAAPAPLERKVRVVYPAPDDRTPVQTPSSTVTHALAPDAAADEGHVAAGRIDPTSTGEGSAAAPSGDLQGLVDINSASADELDRIPAGGRIGRTIVRHRPYRSIDDLVEKRVLRRDVYERIKPQLAAR